LPEGFVMIKMESLVFRGHHKTPTALKTISKSQELSFS